MSVPRKDIKKHHQTAFFRLYHHDKDLLDSYLPPKQQPVPPGKDWTKEDLRLSELIHEIDNIEQLSLSSIDRLIKGHEFLLNHLERLPLTRRLLETKRKI